MVSEANKIVPDKRRTEILFDILLLSSTVSNLGFNFFISSVCTGY